MNDKFRPPESYLPNTTQTLVLVDYSNLLYRAWFVSGKRTWVACCKFFDMLRLCIKRSKQQGVPLKVIFAGESEVILDRAKIFPDYKGTRVGNDDPKFFKFRKELPELLRFIGWEILSIDGAEADDIIASIVAEHCPKGPHIIGEEYTTDIVIFSGDRDLQQCLLWGRTLIYRAPGLFIGKASCEETYGVPIGKFTVYKALIGDKSDNIKGVEGFGPVKAALAINAKTVAEDIWKMSGKKGVEELKLALALVRLNTKLYINLDELYLGVPIFEKEAFVKKYDARVLLELQRLKEEF